MKQALMIVTALGFSMTQAHASADNKSKVQADTIQAAANANNPNDDIQGLIRDLESKAAALTNQKDKLSNYEQELKARRLAEKKQAEALAKANKRKKNSAQKTLARSSKSSNIRSNKNSQRLNKRARPVVAARRAARSAHSRSRGLCARYVRKALQSAGYKFTPNGSAYQYATRGTLRKAGFVKISNRSKPQIGDVVVISRSRAHPHGHIAIYDGRNWVSDFRQKNKSPYRKYYPYTTWRDARYTNASSKGLYMANR